MENLTALEAKLLNNIAYDEMNSSNTRTPVSHDEVHCYLWLDERANALGISEQAAGGVLTSLQKKGLIGVEAPNCKHNDEEREGTRRGNRDPDGGVWFTEAGFAAFQKVDAENKDDNSAELDTMEDAVPEMETSLTVRKYQVNICFNKDETITLYAHGKKVNKLANLDSVHAFLTGWFGTDDKSLWNTKNEFKK